LRYVQISCSQMNYNIPQMNYNRNEKNRLQEEAAGAFLSQS